MKKVFILSALVLVLMIIAVADAQGPGMMGGNWNYCPYCGQYLGPGGGYGMMGRGMMMGPGMMGGHGMGSGMMGHGMMGGGMMGGQGMMGGGMMGPGYQGLSEECQKVMNETTPLRKDLHNKRFEYFEAMRNPKATPESVAKLEKEIRELQEKIYSKAPQGCSW